MSEWFERDSFWETFEDFMFDQRRVDLTRGEVDRMIDLMHLAPDAKVDRGTAANVYASLRDGGRFILDMNGKENLARKFRERDWHRRDDGRILLEERRLLDGWSRIETHWILLDADTRRELSFTLRIYSGAELAALLRGVGFRSVELYGTLAGAPYDHAAERLIAVSTK